MPGPQPHKSCPIIGLGVGEAVPSQPWATRERLDSAPGGAPGPWVRRRGGGI